MICAHCKTEQPDGGKFCGACGSQVGFHCRFCGGVNPDWFAFCGACGQQLDALAGGAVVAAATAAVATAGAASARLAAAGHDDDLREHQKVEHEAWERLGLAEGERRQVTVLFADVSGFTAMSEKKDPEEMNVIMHEVMGDLGTIIRGYDGHIEKFIGDAICAIFGAPISHKDEPERACAAALEMHRAVAAWSSRHPDLPTLSMHIGINTGLVVAGTTGDGSQFGVTGDTINTAARLEGKAVAGQTFVSPETARRVRRQFLLEEMGAYEFKGKEKPVTVYNVVRELTAEEAEEQRILRAPLIGREDEMNMLLASARRTIRERSGSTVLIVGEAGTGKTRLLEELTAAMPDEVRVMQAVARVHGGKTFGVLADALRSVVEVIPPGDAQAVARSLLGDGSAPLSELERVLAAALVEQSQQQPVAVLIDNLEYADQSSIDLLRSLTATTADGAVLWVLACRLGSVAFDAVTMEGPSVTKMRLRALSHDDAVDLFEALLPGALDHELKNTLADRSEGNPEFAEAIALSFVDEAVVVESEGGWKLVGDPDLVEIPGTLQELIEARIDALSDAARTTLQEAAVIGLSFTPDVLEAVSSVPDRLEASVAELVTAELIRPPSLLNAAGAYAFKSPLVREVAYSSILHRRRPGYHAKVGEALLRLNGGNDEELAEILAHHFEEAEDVPRAVHYLGVASAKAEVAYAFRSAEDLTSRALALRKRFPDRVDHDRAASLLERRGLCRMIDNDHDDMLTDLVEAGELWALLDQPHHQGRVLDLLACFLTLAYRLDDAVGVAEQAVAIADSHELLAVRAGVSSTLQLIMAIRGEPARALAEMPAIAATAEESGDRAISLRARAIWGAIEHWEGHSAAAATRLREVREETLAEHLPVLYALASWWLVLAEMELGRYREAMTEAESLLAHAEKAGDVIARVRVHSALGTMYHELGDLRRSDEHSQRSVRLAEQAGAPPEEHIPAAMTMAEVALDRGDAEQAKTRLAATDPEITGDHWMAWRFGARHDFIRGRAALLAGDLDSALEAVAAMRDRLAGSGSRKDRLRADWVEGEARARIGQPEAADLLKQAAEEAAELGSPYLIAEVNLALARAVPDVAERARIEVNAALRSMQSAAPDELGPVVAGGPIARELDRLESVTS